MNRPPEIKTKITEMFGLKYPIFSAPMFLVSEEQIVRATASAGGMGCFPALNYRPIENFKRVVQELKQSGCSNFGVNLIVQKSNPHQKAQLDICVHEEVPLIITSLGSPRQVIEAARGSKTKVFCDVVGLEHAKKVADLGADGLIVVGSGAGGHGGTNSLFALLPYLKQQVGLPMLAAGCISDGKGLAAALALGAEGVYMGTRFIASKEAQVSEEYKNSILKSGIEDIVNTDRVDGFDGNFILTDNLKKVLRPNLIDDVLSQNKRVKRFVSLARAAKSLLGDVNQKLSYKNVFSAGQGVGTIDQLMTVEEIIFDAAKEYQEIVNDLQSRT